MIVPLPSSTAGDASPTSVGDNPPCTESEHATVEREEEQISGQPRSTLETGLQSGGAPELPEGGFQAWATVFGAFWVQFCTFGYTSSFGVYQDFYSQTYLTNESSSAISWIGSVNAFLLISSGLFVGILYDRGYFYPLTIGGALLYSFSLFMLSLAKANQYYRIFLSQSLGAGIGAGMLYIPSLAIASHYFRRRRYLVMTLIASGSSLGAVLHPIMLNNSLNGSLGFANGVRASAGLISGLLLVACIAMRPRIPSPASHPNFFLSSKAFSRDSAYVAATMGFSMFSVGFFFPLFYIQSDSITHDLNRTFSFYSLGILNAASFLGRLSSGFLANQLGVANLIIVATFGGSALILGMIGLSSLSSVIVIATFYGWFIGVFVALMTPLVTILTHDLSELGLRMGIAFAIAGVGGLIGQPIAGALLTDNYIWWRPALFCGVIAAGGCCMFIIMQVILEKRAPAVVQKEM